jgi:hypothetical protein
LKVILASDSSFVVRGNIIHDTELIRKPNGPLGLFKLAFVGQTAASSHESKQPGRSFENGTREIFCKKPLVLIILHGVRSRETVTRISRKFLYLQGTRKIFFVLLLFSV